MTQYNNKKMKKKNKKNEKIQSIEEDGEHAKWDVPTGSIIKNLLGRRSDDMQTSNKFTVVRSINNLVASALTSLCVCSLSFGLPCSTTIVNEHLSAHEGQYFKIMYLT